MNTHNTTPHVTGVWHFTHKFNDIHVLGKTVGINSGVTTIPPRVDKGVFWSV